jgi:hypothetical protein
MSEILIQILAFNVGAWALMFIQNIVSPQTREDNMFQLVGTFISSLVIVGLVHLLGLVN